MQRAVPADLAFQNERTRWGTWAFLSQQLTPNDVVSISRGYQPETVSS
jgi:hypothetical protein